MMEQARMCVDSPFGPDEQKPVSRWCPNCGRTSSLRIVYGYPGEEMVEDAKAGKIVLGGCVVEPDSPRRECQICGHRWR